MPRQTDPDGRTGPQARQRAMRVTAIVCAAGIAGMVGLAYAAVPLYQLFCKATGFAGTPRIASAASATTGARTYTVRFDSNVAPGLTWHFEPEQASVSVKPGETTTIFYKITNTGQHAASGLATFNVVPELTGGYFNKIQCFCFNEITLGPGESMDAPVVFFLDPKIEKDPDLATLDTITLSYTFFVPKGSPKPVAEAKDVGRPRL
jgi:cytochrome c oxidase assembly protein subunit 11